MLDEIHPKLKEQKTILEKNIQREIIDAVNHFESQTGVYITDISCIYHKDQKMLKNEVDAKFNILLDKGIH
jgi:hypothetical protein